MFELVAIRDAIQKHAQQRFEPGAPASVEHTRVTKEAALRRLARPARGTAPHQAPARQGSLLGGC